MDHGTIAARRMPDEQAAPFARAIEQANRDADALLEGFGELGTDGRRRVLELIAELRGAG